MFYKLLAIVLFLVFDAESGKTRNPRLRDHDSATEPEVQVTSRLRQDVNNNWKPFLVAAASPSTVAPVTCPVIKPCPSVSFGKGQAAATIEEAILTFKSPVPDNFQDQNTPYDDGDRCISTRCKACAVLMTSKLKQLNALDNKSPAEVLKKLGINKISNIDTDNCNDLKELFARSKIESTRKNSKNTQIVIQDILLEMTGDPKFEYNSTILGDEPLMACENGRRYALACFTRGDAVINTGSGSFSSLCNHCWTIREMPRNYFPRYLNEMTCTQDRTCFAGYGVCRNVERSLQVMHEPSERIETTNLNMGCECQIPKGSLFDEFIKQVES